MRDGGEGARDGRGEPAREGRRRYVETLPNGVRYGTLDIKENGFLDDTKEVTVPPGGYFVLGDNRDNSSDSRVADIGFVPRDRFIGRVARILLSVDPDTHELRADRFLRPVH